MIVAARYMLAGMLLVAPLLADGKLPDSLQADSLKVDTLEIKMDSLQAQQDDMNVRLLSIRNFLVKRLAAAELDTLNRPRQLESPDSLTKSADTSMPK